MTVRPQTLTQEGRRLRRGEPAYASGVIEAPLGSGARR